jgi:hypothetical protein
VGVDSIRPVVDGFTDLSSPLFRLIKHGYTGFDLILIPPQWTKAGILAILSSVVIDLTPTPPEV